MLARRLMVSAALVLALDAWALTGPVLGQAKAIPVPEYPRVNLATWYQVEPGWPQRPADARWEAVPGIAVDGQDQVYVFTRGTPPVQVYDASGKHLRSWGQDVITFGHYIRFDSQGNVWVADVGSHTVMQFTPEGKLLKTLGTRDEPGCDERHFNKPTDMAVTPDGDVYVTDGYGNARVAQFDKEGRFVRSWGQLGTGPGEFSLVHSIVRDSQGRLYVADRNNVRVQVFAADGQFLAEWRNLLVPWGLWITDKDEIWACGSSPMAWRPDDGALGCPPKDQLVMRLDTSGRVLQLWTFPKGEDGKEQPGELNWIHCCVPDSQGNLYTGDIQGQRAQKFVPQK